MDHDAGVVCTKLIAILHLNFKEKTIKYPLFKFHKKGFYCVKYSREFCLQATVSRFFQ